ncbi:hypothetical protein HBH98_232970 [Parastagonospora nodorum]|nr:hypothetical protein HBH98_232970 [Parastagonospora nodorum]KAH4356361.1 hypothetical protein HBH97_232080 [Parastagonospora nodorum]KAH4371980.1 hypothetical protein HBH99_234270 [Parastagonospora nodorum]KAH4401264.1 hypothetical protein HBH92_226800 [Parastagonospora nodorum]KAH4405460.1 hypothetical protein HBH93_232350 [Parastagonospora nodorum]
MPKRKRAASEGCCPLSSRASHSKSSSPPLTTANLELLQHSLSAPVPAHAPVIPPAMPPSASNRSSSPSRSGTTYDAIQKLEEYNIFIDDAQALPDCLQRFVDDVILKPRDPTTAPSPNAKKIVKRQRAAARVNEAAGREQLVPYLLFQGEFNDREGVELVPFINCLPEERLNRFFLPPCPDEKKKKTWGPLTQPRPDTCIGYLQRGHARAAGCEAPFTDTEQTILNNYVINKSMYAPFLTGQWKSPLGTENILVARCQAARDGATVVSYLSTFYRIAYGREPSPVDACHFSVIGDVITGQIWIHYQLEGAYYMHKLCSFAYDDQASLERARGYLHNIKHHALGTRLQSIKDALPAFEAGKRVKPFPVVDMTESGGPLPSLPDTDASNFRAPMTPASVVSEPTKKRQRVDGSGAD